MTMDFFSTFPFAQTIALFLILATLLGPLACYMAKVFELSPTPLDRFFGPMERFIYRLSAVSPRDEMTGRRYIMTLLLFSGLCVLCVMMFIAAQTYPVVSFEASLNIAVSFMTNTNWQGYVPETTLTPTTQHYALAVQNFLSAAVGLCVLAALIRGLKRQKTDTIGNFWCDLVRGVLYILLPLAFLFSLALVAEGSPQTFGHTLPYAPIDGQQPDQLLMTGPVASQVAIKQLGSNGGGYFAANAAHPFENPTPLSNFLGLLAILLLPAASVLMFGKMIGNTRQGYVILAVMAALLLPLLLFCLMKETALPANLEGKELRFGVEASALWASLTTATSNGSLNASLESFRPLAGLVPLLFIHLGEVVFGGVGSGLYGMLIYVLFSVFISGLMIGRTPEYLGKKIGALEVKMASLALLFPALATLVGTALAVATLAGQSGATNPGAQGFTQILYAFSSASGNNGSAFAGIAATGSFYQWGLALCMLAGRFGVMIPVLVIASSLAKKAAIQPSAGTLRTDTPLFAIILFATILLLGALTYVPALVLGPVVEHLTYMNGGAI